MFHILELEQLAQLAHRVLRRRDRVSDRPRVGVNLVVVATLVRLVAEEVDLLEVFGRNVLERVRLVPARRAVAMRTRSTPIRLWTRATAVLTRRQRRFDHR